MKLSILPVLCALSYLVFTAGFRGFLFPQWPNGRVIFKEDAPMYFSRNSDGSGNGNIQGDHESKRSVPLMLFGGGGIYFYWQIGVVSYLRQQNYNLQSTLSFAGASSGALAATLTATNVDTSEATTLALDLAEKAGVWKRGSLQGIWGDLIYEWLDHLIPSNALEYVSNDRLALLVTPLPLIFKKKRFTEFKDREDLIKCNMASVHLPFFLNGKFSTKFRGKACVDGSFLAKEYHFLDSYQPSSSIILRRRIKRKKNNYFNTNDIISVDWRRDPSMANNSWGDFVKLTSKDGIWDMVQRGEKFAQLMEEKGEFELIPRTII